MLSVVCWLSGTAGGFEKPLEGIRKFAHWHGDNGRVLNNAMQPPAETHKEKKGVRTSSGWNQFSNLDANDNQILGYSNKHSTFQVK